MPAIMNTFYFVSDIYFNVFEPSDFYLWKEKNTYFMGFYEDQMK